MTGPQIYSTKFLDPHAALKLDDGRPARDLGVHDLRREMQRMGCDVDPSMGKHVLLDKLAEHRVAQAAAAEAELQRLRNPVLDRIIAQATGAA